MVKAMASLMNQRTSHANPQGLVSDLEDEDIDALLEQELEITSSNKDDQPPQDKADLMATSQGIPDDGVISSQGPPLSCAPNMEPMDELLSP
ncbi:hypothetical protein IWQ61_004883 [Dispira simplex]|nr:hypothetical protein IWQ61_004883 [Dispira simplex]